ncbi:hypothetical protein F2Q68_00026492 [Brassica cretica]|uniref:Uncharacterized protein n=1 Tax=Brassica cretica TaxID=69181 RepID=A0A8S9IG31_BRACR|nr:hypothetical protein F2Q68_00026492 [Brassica cretica]
MGGITNQIARLSRLLPPPSPAAVSFQLQHHHHELPLPSLDPRFFRSGVAGLALAPPSLMKPSTSTASSRP